MHKARIKSSSLCNSACICLIDLRTVCGVGVCSVSVSTGGCVFLNTNGY